MFVWQNCFAFRIIFTILPLYGSNKQPFTIFSVKYFNSFFSSRFIFLVNSYLNSVNDDNQSSTFYTIAGLDKIRLYILGVWSLLLTVQPYSLDYRLETVLNFVIRITLVYRAQKKIEKHQDTNGDYGDDRRHALNNSEIKQINTNHELMWIEPRIVTSLLNKNSFVFIGCGDANQKSKFLWRWTPKR